MKKKTVVSVMVVVMLFAVSLFFVGGTYARYVEELTGNATVDVAKWNVALKNGEDSLENSFTLKLTPEENANVASGKIAPSYTATGTIQLDLTETEVAVDVLAEVSSESLTNIFGGAPATVKINIDGQDYSGGLSGQGKKFDLPEKAAFTSVNGKKDIKITVTWEDELDGTHDSTDTTKGKTAGTVQIPVTLKVQQHIDSE